MNNGKTKVHKYTDEEKQFLKEFVPGHTHKEIQEEFIKQFKWDISIRQISGSIKRYGLKTGFTGRFEKGHIPMNKGQKKIHYAGTEKTWFAKGHIPYNTRKVGDESVRHNYKRGQKYVYVKVAEPNKWRMKHIIEWEKHNGKVKEGYVITFMDGNTLNTDINNLKMISRKIHAILNKNDLRQNNKEGTEVAINIARLYHEITKAKKKIGGTEC